MPKEKGLSAAAGARRPGSPDRSIERQMLRSLVTGRLLVRLQEGAEGPFDVIVALNEVYPGGLAAAGKDLQKHLARTLKIKEPTRVLSANVICRLNAGQLVRLSEWHYATTGKGGVSPIYRIWEDEAVELMLTRSTTTVKADAAQASFAAMGEGIVWAVVDSGIDGAHPHFRSSFGKTAKIDTLSLPDPLQHIDFTSSGDPLKDETGHGTHVAGIIAGAWKAKSKKSANVAGVMTLREGEQEPRPGRATVERISGIAPLAKVVSLKVVSGAESGRISSVLAALDQIQRWNDFGRSIRVHGVNLSIGYPFNPEWFGCGHSPVCAEVNRLVKSGVVVVAAAGNGGYMTWLDANNRVGSGFSSRSITDPGNADLAITVGSTHRDKPHTYGVSYFSSRGPTGDGRLKPDLVAPGERILSCAAGLEKAKYGKGALYCEQTGTSAAAPHVSGAIAAFLSVRREFIGQPEKVKQVFAGAAMDIERDASSQGRGLLDLEKALRSV